MSTTSDPVLLSHIITQLQGWKFCRCCGGLTTWAGARFDPLSKSLICPNCQKAIVEWPAGVPLVCPCGEGAIDNFFILSGDAICLTCGQCCWPSPDYFPDTQPCDLPRSGPGVEGAEPLSGGSRPVEAGTLTLDSPDDVEAPDLF